jgi:hypothetical protein
MMDSEPTPSQFSMSNFETLVAGIELLYGVGRKLSDAIARQPCEYLVQEASMAFVKTMMSVFGFLRFIPASRFSGNVGETVTDLSSASVIGRQVLEDTISFFYLSEPNLTPQEKCLRLATQLRAGGVDAHLDHWHAVPGDQVPEFMQ